MIAWINADHNTHLVLSPYIHRIAHSHLRLTSSLDSKGMIGAQETTLVKLLSNACYAIQRGHVSERHTGKDNWLLANISFYLLINYWPHLTE